MMRFLAIFVATTLPLAFFGAANCPAQATVQGQQPGAGQQAAPGQQPGPPQPNDPAAAPFTLTPQEQTGLDQMLIAWERQSSGTQRLEAKFRRWHYDPLAAPLGIHSSWAEGVLKYAAPDRGLFRVDTLKVYAGMVDGKPTYNTPEGTFGEHWVCNGKELLEFDRNSKQCLIRQLPPEIRGKEIFDSPLPFVFNLNAEKIKRRYWVRQVEAPQQGVILLEAFPKLQADRAQYRFVRIVMNAETFLPQALILYGPNFHPTTSPAYDHYEFLDVERNSITGGLANFVNQFINERPPASWKVVQDTYRPELETQIAQPGEGNTIR